MFFSILSRLWVLSILLPVFGDEPLEVHNELTPKETAQTIVLTEDLRFGGGDGDEPFLWGGANVTVSVDGKGQMYVSDQGNIRVMEFDPEGKFVRQIVREGSGPGEVKRLIQFVLLKDGGALCHHAAGGVSLFSRFDKEMRYVRTFGDRMKDGNVVTAVIAPDGKRLGVKTSRFDSDQKKLVANYGIVDETGKYLIELVEQTNAVFDRDRATDPAYLAPYLAEFYQLDFAPMGLTAFDDEGRAYTALTDRYVITRWDPALKEKQLVIHKKHKPKIFTDADKEAYIEKKAETIKASWPSPYREAASPAIVRRAVERTDIPPAKAPLVALKALPDGLLLVIRDSGADGTADADIFDENGRFLGTFAMPGVGLNTMVFKNSFAYTVIADENDELVLVRYRYRLTPL